MIIKFSVTLGEIIFTLAMLFIIFNEIYTNFIKKESNSKPKILTVEEIRTKLGFVSPEKYKNDWWLKRVKPILDKEKKQGEYVDYERRTGRTTELMLEALTASQMYNVVIFAHTLSYAKELKDEMKNYVKQLDLIAHKIEIGSKDRGYDNTWFKFYDHTYTDKFYINIE